MERVARVGEDEDYTKTLVGMPIPVDEPSKAWVCSRSPAEIAGSNPAEGMDVCRKCSCVVR